MSLLNETELDARLKAIRSGPWMRRARLARSKLGIPAEPVFQEFIAQPNLNLRAFPLNTHTLIRTHSLAKTLRWHGRSDGPTPAQRRIRNSFDDALTYFQLLELAIETGYLPEEQVKPGTKEALASLCWSEPARRFIHDYEYTSVEALANRLHIGGFYGQPLRKVDPSGAVHFAAFLATHKALERDTACNAWLAFLDDYIRAPGEQDDFYKFLASGASARTRRRETLLAGAHTFVVMLADLLTPLPPRLQVRFGGFYQYWLARLYGYARGRSGFIRDTAVWGDTSWAQSLQFWFRRRATMSAAGSEKVDKGPEMAELSEEHVTADLFEESLTVLTDVWRRILTSEHPAKHVWFEQSKSSTRHAAARRYTRNYGRTKV